jgi:hypothetical protein
MSVCLFVCSKSHICLYSKSAESKYMSVLRSVQNTCINLRCLFFAQNRHTCLCSKDDMDKGMAVCVLKRDNYWTMASLLKRQLEQIHVLLASASTL